MAVSDEIPGPPATGDTSGRRRHPLGSGRRARRGRVVRLPAALGVLLALAAVAGAARLPARGEPARIAYGVDGDTVELAGGERVRLVQIDTPEVYGSPECYGEQASAVTRRLLPRGTAVRLYAEPRTDAVDAYGRLLRYVFRVRDGLDVNVELVRVGAAAPYFYDGRRGRYAGLLVRLALRARSRHLGLWGRCPRTPWDPTHGVSTGSP